MVQETMIDVVIESLEWLGQQHDVVDGGELNYQVGSIRNGGAEAVKALRAENAELRRMLGNLLGMVRLYNQTHDFDVMQYAVVCEVEDALATDKESNDG